MTLASPGHVGIPIIGIRFSAAMVRGLQPTFALAEVEPPLGASLVKHCGAREVGGRVEGCELRRCDVVTRLECEPGRVADEGTAATTVHATATDDR